MKKIEWYGCYRASWNAAPLIPEAYSHPAKVAFGLAERIYKHMLEQGYIKPGQIIVDPFGGIAGFAFHALRNGLHWKGIELEQNFVELGQANIALWNNRYAAHFPNWGTAEIQQGDSRFLTAVLSMASGEETAPPFVDGGMGDSRPYGGIKEKKKHWNEITGPGGLTHYGRSPNQLGNLPTGSVDAAVISPPYAETVQGAGEGPGARFDHVTHRGENATKKSSLNGYGQTEGNLGNLAAGAVTSPPFENGLPQQDRNFTASHDSTRNLQDAVYGSTPNNIGNQTGPTFWESARDILTELYAVLTPGGYAAFVTGNYRRDGKVVPFGEQWLQLCEAVGFVGIEHITAWKYEPRPAQLDIFGNVHSRDVHRVSFFRRLDNQKNPGNEILSEEVWIVRKPAVK